MSNLKFRAVEGKEIEIEGEADLVIQLLEKYYTPFTTKSASEQVVDNLPTTDNVQSVPKILSLMDLVYKGKERPEAEWLLIYGYFINEKQFSRGDLLKTYRETQRYTENRRKNLSFNLKVAVKNGWINVISPTAFSVSPEGRKRVDELLKNE